MSVHSAMRKTVKKSWYYGNERAGAGSDLRVITMTVIVLHLIQLSDQEFIYKH